MLVCAGAVIVLAASTETSDSPLPEARSKVKPGGSPSRPSSPTSPLATRPRRAARRAAPVRWRRSVAVGVPGAGRLVGGVKLPARGPGFATWDPITRRSPSRGWRRFGTDRLVRTLLRVTRRYAVAHPGARPLAIGDLSRPRGGSFGPQFGFIGHQTHQNGLDADVYYPRTDRRLTPPKSAALIDRRLAQDLVDRFLAAGAEAVLIGPATRLKGPPGRVKVVPNHDNHLHVRMPNPRRGS